jgi:hypothetical protein
MIPAPNVTISGDSMPTDALPAKPLPYDLEDTRLNEYKDLIPKWHDWSTVEAAAARVAELLLEHL